MKRKKVKKASRDTICSALASALPAVLRGDWMSFSVESRDYKIKLAWDRDCEGVTLTGFIEPSAEL